MCLITEGFNCAGVGVLTPKKLVAIYNKKIK